jgi:hypothetical protein
MTLLKSLRLSSAPKLLCAAAIAAVMLVAAVPAQADWHHDGGHYRGGWGWGVGPGVYFGLGTPYYYDYGPGPAYADPYYSPYNGY